MTNIAYTKRERIENSKRFKNYVHKPKIKNRKKEGNKKKE